MLTHVTDAQIGAFRSRRLAPADLVTFTDHLADCAECRRRTAMQSDTASALAALDAAVGKGDEHLSEEDLQAFVDRRIPAERAADVSAHLSECVRCAEDVRDLQAFVDADAAVNTSRRQSGRLAYAALALAASLLVAVGGWFALRTRPAPRPGDAVAAETPARGNAFAGLTAEDQARVQTALTTRALAIPASITELIGRRGALLGAEFKTPLQLLAPVGTVVREDRPVLRWSNVAGASQYVVTVQDSSGRTFNSEPLTATEWTLDRTLARGERYAWQVATTANGREVVAPAPPEPPAQFTVLGAADAARLDRLPDVPLVRGILCASMGLLDDAEREFARATEPGPDAELAGTFLSQLRKTRLAR